MKGMGNMIKQAQKLQSRMASLQEEMAEKVVEATAGGGMIKVAANGRQQILSIQIEKEVVSPSTFVPVASTTSLILFFSTLDVSSLILILSGPTPFIGESTP